MYICIFLWLKFSSTTVFGNCEWFISCFSIAELQYPTVFQCMWWSENQLNSRKHHNPRWKRYGYVLVPCEHQSIMENRCLNCIQITVLHSFCCSSLRLLCASCLNECFNLAPKKKKTVMPVPCHIHLHLLQSSFTWGLSLIHRAIIVFKTYRYRFSFIANTCKWSFIRKKQCLIWVIPLSGLGWMLQLDGVLYFHNFVA